MSVGSVATKHVVCFPKGVADSHGNGFLPRIEMNGASNLPSFQLLREFLLDETDQYHPFEEAQAIGKLSHGR